MLISEDKLIEICEQVAGGELAISLAAEKVGVKRRTLFNWLEASKAGTDERLNIRWPGDDLVPFHRCLSLARDMAALDIRGEFERRCLKGTEEPVYFQGRPQWKEREDLVGLDDWLVEMLGYPDRWERDKFGRRVQLTIRHAPATAAVIKYLESRFSDEYRSTVNQNVNVGGGLNIGVLSMPVQALPTRASGPPPIPPAPRRPMIAPPLPEEPVDASFTEAADPMASTGTPPPADDDFSVEPPAAPIKAEVVIREAAPAQYQPRAEGPMSDLQRDLLARLRGDPVTRSAPIAPTGKAGNFAQRGEKE
ncbi:hypothetical protein [Bradyrhizobium genosp. P]|uniref:hypothetical protein n=1 Tax=Bradyrhizobium genosp. P TaxID=83641 RepID=UPI003CF9002F